MRYLSLFSGIGAPEKALDRLGINYELVGYSEIDKYASRSYAAIHGVDESMNLGDITKVDEKQLPKDIDLITYGFPCQDISVAGKQKGLFNVDGTQTRSGLFFEALRIIEETQPRVAIAENVKNLTGKKFAEQFKLILESLEQAGYNNYWKVLNAKDFGVPQNRERVFIVSIRKDIDNGTFRFPEGFPLELRLKDVLEDEVDEKFFLSDVQIEKIHMAPKEALVYDKSMLGFEVYAREYNDVMPTITSSEWKGPRLENQSKLVGAARVKKAGNIYPSGGENGNVYLNTGLSPTLKAGTGVTGNGIGSCNAPKILNSEERIRKLTPKECFRLMDFDDADYEKAASVNSNTQLYKQVGNSIVVAVPKFIIAQLVECGALSMTY